jgi:predicted Zn-dependent protease
MRKWQALLLAAIVVLTMSSCLSLPETIQAYAYQAVTQGLLTPEQAQMLIQAAKNASQASKDLTPEEEYYVGRAVAAMILSQYPAYECKPLDEYLNKLGQGLATYSVKPEIFAGYSFFVLDSPEINAFASPGGHILVTRGLLELTTSEDELAAVLAHEIAHVALGHGLASVQSVRLAQIASDFALQAGKVSGSDVADFTAAFGGAISDIAKTLVISGYSQSFELQADLEARRILVQAGYDPLALEHLIARLPHRTSSSQEGFAVTHPDPDIRIESLRNNPLDVEGESAWGARPPRIKLTDRDDFAEQPFSEKGQGFAAAPGGPGAAAKRLASIRKIRYDEARAFF